MKAFDPVWRMTLPLLAVATFAVSALAVSAAPARAQDGETYDAWAPGRQWMTVRAGYAKSAEDSAGHGAGGYGMTFRRMLSGLKVYKWTLFKNYSLGASVQHDVLGRFGPASEVEIAATVDLIRHYAWSPRVRPYVGLGAGPYYRKTYRTGDDMRDVSLGWFVTTGMNTPVSGRHLIGFDVRMSRVKGKNDPPNPVFGLGSVDVDVSGTRVSIKERPTTHWSIKVDYAFTF